MTPATSAGLAELTPDRLQTFLAVARHENFTAAAREVHLSQSAVSRQIAALEKALGIQLFERFGKTAHLTSAGRGLVPEFRRILGDLALVHEAAKGLEGGSRGTLRIGASATPGLYLIPPALTVFQRRYPDVDLHYVVSNTKQIQELVVENELDAGFVGGTVTEASLRVDELAQDEVVCFAAKGHPLARRSRIRPDEIGRETLVMREEGSATGALFKSWLIAAGGRIGRTIDLACPEAVKTIVAAGLGVGCLSRLGLQDELSRTKLVVLPIAAPRLRRPLSLIRHPRKSAQAALEALIDMVRDSAKTAARRR